MVGQRYDPNQVFSPQCRMISVDHTAQIGKAEMSLDKLERSHHAALRMLKPCRVVGHYDWHRGCSFLEHVRAEPRLPSKLPSKQLFTPVVRSSEPVTHVAYTHDLIIGVPLKSKCELLRRPRSPVALELLPMPVHPILNYAAGKVLQRIWPTTEVGRAALLMYRPVAMYRGNYHFGAQRLATNPLPRRGFRSSRGTSRRPS